MIEEEDLGRLLGRLKKSLDWHQFIVAVRQRFTAFARRDTSWFMPANCTAPQLS